MWLTPTPFRSTANFPQFQLTWKTTPELSTFRLRCCGPGALGSSVAGLILSQSLRIAMIAGMGAAFLLTRFLSGMLFGVTATDPLTFAGVVLLVFVVTVTASSIPAWRAARIDPIRILRAE